MGEMPDFHVGERVDMLATITIAPRGLDVGKYEALFKGKVRFLWEHWIDVQAGEQVFRVPRTAIKSGFKEGDPWCFNAKDADGFHEIEDYMPEEEIDYEAEDDDAE